MTPTTKVKYTRLAARARAFHHTQQCRIELYKVVRNCGGDPPQYVSQLLRTLHAKEKLMYKQLETSLMSSHFWNCWLKAIKGIGPALGSALVGETNIKECKYPSSMWQWWGIAPSNGRAMPSTRVSSYRKRKCDRIAEQFLQQGTKPYVGYYEKYKHRKETTMVPKCWACKGKGTFFGHECRNCNGTGGPAPWGMNGEHRHRAAKRYMVQRFLEDMWRAWRELEGLPCAKNYAKTYQPGVHPEGK